MRSIFKHKIWQKFPAVAGAALLLFPNGILWYWGNLSVLVLSYFVSKLNQKSGVETPWVVSLYIIFRVLGLLLYDIVKKVCGKHWLVLIGFVISDASQFFCYFAVQKSLVLVDVAMGACVGLGSGFLYGHALHIVVGLTEKHVGLFTCIIQGSLAAGAIIINQFVTLYINPENLSPDLRHGFSSYFAQKEVLDKVPTFFLYIGTFSVVSHVFAFILLNLDHVARAFSPSNSNKEKTILSEEGPTPSSYKALEDPKDIISTLPPSSDSSNSVSQQKDYTPKEMLQTMAFATLWFLYFVGDFPLLLAINYYKTFGQIWIHDDYFLTELGTTILFFNAWLRSVWGAVVDRIGSKNTLVLILGPLILLNIWYYFSAMHGKWIYFVTAFLYSSLAAALYSIFPAMVAHIFGKTHFSANYGLLTTASILFNLVGPVGLEAILTQFGWFVTLASSAILNTVGLLLLLKFVP